VTRIALAAVILAFALAGCASWFASERPSATLLVKADGLVDQGEYARAIDAYDELLARYPDDAAAPRARSSRIAVARLVAAREEADRLRRDLEAARQSLAAREGDLQRTRQELQRVTAESERLRADLERLKRIDLELERRRR